MKIIIKELRGIIILYLINFIVLISLFYYLSDFTIWTLLYFILLSTSSFIIYLLYYYIQRKNFFRALANCDIESLSRYGNNSALPYAIKRCLEKSKSEHEKKIAQYRLSHQEHISFIDKWVHYIKTPIAVIRMIIQESNENNNLSGIDNEAEKIIHGVNMALYFSRSTNISDDFHAQTINLKETAIEAVNNLRIWFIKNEIYPQIEIDNNITIKSDLKWIRFIFTQIITNAVQYSSKGGKVIIYCEEGNSHLKICFKDSGCGIAKEDMGRIFDLFFTGKNGRARSESTGIGLYLVKKVCDNMGYSIEVDSIPQLGTTFKIVVNRAPLQDGDYIC